MNLLDQLENDLEKGSRKIEVWVNSIGVKTINMDYPNQDPYFNMNTKEDLEQGKELL